MERQRFWRDRGGWNYQLLVIVKGERVKVLIHRDSYDFQSYARAYLFSDASMSWSLVASIAYPEMESLQQKAHDSKCNWRNFETDENALLEEVRWILQP